MSVLVVTGTDTGVGKTVVTAAVTALAIERGGPVAVVKPAQTGVEKGEPGDLDEVIPALGRDEHLRVRPLPRPAEPAAAARVSGLPDARPHRRGGRITELAESHRLVVVEGAGGLLVRFDEEGATLADLAHTLKAQVAGRGTGPASAPSTTRP